MEDRLSRIVLLTERYLNQIFGSLRVYREDGEFLIPWGSTVINVEVRPEGEEVHLRICSPVVLRVKPDKELMKFLLMENTSLTMCSFSVEFERGLLDIVLGTKVKFDFVTKELLSYLAINVGNLANEYGKEIMAVFGGVSFKEYVEKEKLQKRIATEEKILHDIFDVGDLRIILELYRLAEGGYLIVGKMGEAARVFLRAERRKEIQEVFEFLEKLKEFILRKDIASLKKHLKHYEIEEYFLYNILAGKEEERAKRLREIDREIHFLTDLLMRGEISQEEYKRRISDIEKLLGL